ncbi:ABC transporter substrate-binding protein [Paenibacillus sp. GCM10012307]|uniref:Iron-siderophore ABC transporter substrate-binding protein n=1 Tax=Paenibacillus roseus TaxID=2798579 RepID=A0A934J471_9BACL|nr:iron-siderophore ABC transporter substrate-binding protein [Paenibacillus roseus]MBJ6362969.1 iron-siderophore ABC transporter substrate-binding protein [Paenibacillus roseus]
MQSSHKYSSRKLTVLGLLVVSILLVLSGCSSSTKTESVNSPAQASGNKAEAGTNAYGAEVHKVNDAYGEVEVPANPQKIVVLDIGALDNLLELGIKPIGAPSILTAGDPYPAYLKGTEGIANIGTVNEPNLEAIDALKPDLIIGNKDTHDAIHDQLKQIAPTVFVETLGVTWKANLELHADTVNKQAEAEKLLEAYKQKTEDIKSRLADAKGREVSLIRPRADKIQVYLEGTFAGTVMKDSGVIRPAAQSGEGFSKDATEEQIADLDGDIILWFNREPDAFAKLEKSPLWANLKGVQSKNVHAVDWEYWMSGLGIQAVNKVADDLNSFLFAS